MELLLLYIEWSELRWLRHLFWMPPGHLTREMFWACPTERRLQGRPRKHWRENVSQLAWGSDGVLLKELEEVTRAGVCSCLLRLLLCNRALFKFLKIDGWVDGWRSMYRQYLQVTGSRQNNFLSP